MLIQLFSQTRHVVFAATLFSTLAGFAMAAERVAHVVRQHRLLPCLASASALLHLELDAHDGCLLFDLPAISSLRRLVLKVGNGTPTRPSPRVPGHTLLHTRDWPPVPC